MTVHAVVDPGPDLKLGVDVDAVPPGAFLVGHAGEDSVLLAHLNDGFHAVSATCTHYGAHLGGGLLADNEIRCPCHHAAFDVRTGAALRAPAFRALKTWRTETRQGRGFVREEVRRAEPSRTPGRRHPRRVVIIGGGAAGYAAAERLHARGFDGELTIISADASAPYDRPNLSKGFLAGTAPREWIPLSDFAAYAQRGISLRLNRRVSAIDCGTRRVITDRGGHIPFDALLLATGAAPRRLAPLGGHGRVFLLRTLKDAERLISFVSDASNWSAVVVGSGFIGLEVAAALRHRGLDVQIVSRDAHPLGRQLGADAGRMLQRLHEAQGVRFHNGRAVEAYQGRALRLDDGTTLPADIVVVGVGVLPCSRLATEAGIATQNGILVDACLRTSVKGIYAAGDVACYPHRGEPIRVEHWVHAMRQGEVAADNMLGDERPFDAVPFFWTEQYGVELRASGWLGGWDACQSEGSIADRDLLVRYFRHGRPCGVLTVGRDRENLEFERESEKEGSHVTREPCSTSAPVTAG